MTVRALPLIALSTFLLYSAGGASAQAPAGEQVVPDTVTVAEPLREAEVMPRPIGGLGGINRRVRYPAEARQRGEQGTVFLQFVVTADGRATDISVARSVSPALDAAAIDAVRRTRFRPGRQEGQPVAVRMGLPVSFRLRTRPPERTRDDRRGSIFP